MIILYTPYVCTSGEGGCYIFTYCCTVFMVTLSMRLKSQLINSNWFLLNWYRHNYTFCRGKLLSKVVMVRLSTPHPRDSVLDMLYWTGSLWVEKQGQHPSTPVTCCIGLGPCEWRNKASNPPPPWHAVLDWVPVSGESRPASLHPRDMLYWTGSLRVENQGQHPSTLGLGVGGPIMFNI